MRQVLDLCSSSDTARGECGLGQWWVMHCRPGRGETMGLPSWTAPHVSEQLWPGSGDAGALAEVGADGGGRWEHTREKWIEARVPGDVHLDLLRAGMIAEPTEGRNFAALDWVEQEEWWYLGTFRLSAAQVEAAREPGAELVFAGIDTQARIWLNGHPVGASHNMFRPLRLAVAESLQPGENTLVVQVGVGLERVQGKPLWRLARSWNQDDLRRLWLRKAQFGFGWDWNPRLVSCGIWRPVRLELPGPVTLRNVQVRETLPAAPLPANQPVPASVFIEAEVDAALSQFTDVEVSACWTPLPPPQGADGFPPSAARPQPDCPQPPALDRVTPAPAAVATGAAGRSYTAVFRRRLFPGRNRVAIRMELPEIWPWWPRPLGRPCLYELQLSLSLPASPDGGPSQLLDVIRLRHGFRRVELRQTPRPAVQPDTDEEIAGLPAGEATTFTFVVNGVPVFAQGGNWVPADCLPARVTPEKYRRLVAGAVEAGCNMLRVWGGGIYEDPFFYDLCDELGVMVWQEFMFACGYYPDFDAEFRTEVAAEAEDVVRRLRHHPCLVVWAGNNEIATMAWGHWRWGGRIDPGSPAAVAQMQEYPGQRWFEEILAGICAQHDPTRPYLPSSPMSQPGVEPDDPWQGDTHSWYPGVDYEKDYGRDASGFCSEFGCVGPAAAATLRQSVPALTGADQLAPANYQYALQHVPGLRDHVHPSEEAMVHQRLMAQLLGEAAVGWLQKQSARQKAETPQTRAARAALDQLSLDDWVRWGQLLQAEVLRFAFSHYRRRLWDCSGSLLWMWDDAWPETGWTPVDYYGRPKALYFTLRRLFRPVSLVWRKVRPAQAASTFQTVDSFELFAVNLSRQPLPGRLQYGWWDFRDPSPSLAGETVEIPPLSSTRLATGIRPPADPALAAAGLVFAELVNDAELPEPCRAREFAVPWGRLNLPAEPTIQTVVEVGRVGMVADAFAWDVQVNGLRSSVGLPASRFARVQGKTPGESAERAVYPYDNHFDLFPGRVHWVCTAGDGALMGRSGMELTAAPINSLLRDLQERYRLLAREEC